MEVSHRQVKEPKVWAMHSDIEIVRDFITGMANRYFHVVFDGIGGLIRSSYLHS